MSRKHLLLYMRQQQLERLNMKELMNPEETKPNRQILIQSELERVNTELQQQIQQEQLNRLIRRLKEQQQQFENAKKQTATKHRRKNNMSVTEAPTTRNEISREIKIAVAKSERKERYKSLRSMSQLKTTHDIQQLEQPKTPLQRRPQTALRSAFDVAEPKNLSPGKRGLINLELYKREIQTAMQQERQFRRSSEDNKFQQEILKSVQKCEFRPYSRQSVDTSYNWEKNKKYQAIECFTGNTMYMVGIGGAIVTYKAQFIISAIKIEGSFLRLNPGSPLIWTQGPKLPTRNLTYPIRVFIFFMKSTGTCMDELHSQKQRNI